MVETEDAASCVAGTKPLENNVNQQSISFSFSLQILAREGASLRGDASMQKTSTAPQKIQRASRPIQSTTDIDQEYDGDNASSMPHSAIRFRSTTQPQARTTEPIATPPTMHRVSGITRLGLYALLLLCVAFLINGIVVPALIDVSNQLRYGDARIATFDFDNHHFLTDETNGRVHIVVGNENGSYNQVLTLPIDGVTNHALVTLSQDKNDIEVLINGTYAAVLVPDGYAGYQWGSN